MHTQKKNKKKKNETFIIYEMVLDRDLYNGNCYTGNMFNWIYFGLFKTLQKHPRKTTITEHRTGAGFNDM